MYTTMEKWKTTTIVLINYQCDLLICLLIRDKARDSSQVVSKSKLTQLCLGMVRILNVVFYNTDLSSNRVHMTGLT